MKRDIPILWQRHNVVECRSHLRLGNEGQPVTVAADEVRLDEVSSQMRVGITAAKSRRQLVGQCRLDLQLDTLTARVIAIDDNLNARDGRERIELDVVPLHSVSG